MGGGIRLMRPEKITLKNCSLDRVKTPQLHLLIFFGIEGSIPFRIFMRFYRLLFIKWNFSDSVFFYNIEIKTYIHNYLTDQLKMFLKSSLSFLPLESVTLTIATCLTRAQNFYSVPCSKFYNTIKQNSLRI